MRKYTLACCFLLTACVGVPVRSDEPVDIPCATAHQFMQLTKELQSLREDYYQLRSDFEKFQETLSNPANIQDFDFMGPIQF